MNGKWGPTLTFPKRRNLRLWQDLTKNIVQIYYLLKPTLQTSFMSAFCHFIKLSVHRLLLNRFANLVSKVLIFPDLQLPPTTRQLRLKWSVRNHLKDNREKIKLQFTRNCNFLCLLLKTVFMGAALTFSWPGGTSGYPGQKHGVNIIIPSSNQRVNFLHAARHHTSLSLMFQNGTAADTVGAFLCCHAKGGGMGCRGGGGFEGALTALPPHSLPLTLHLFPRLKRQTEKTCLAHLRV